MGETTAIAPTTTGESDGDLTYCIIKGLKQRATEKTLELLKEKTPLQVIDEHIIPALNTVGDGFEKKTVFLPQLLISAETASCAFDVIKSKFSGDAPAKNLKIVVATVKDDIHDIGKNIVKTLLENYGFSVIDLGKDVPAQAVLDAVKKSGAKLVGLSALMTTTVVNMKEIVSRIKSECPDVYVMVGGAVLTKEYALSMGADAYCKDGMQAVRYAEEVERAI
jgi:5-methyltetrahydrofolate--homocysteine methyltransferase